MENKNIENLVEDLRTVIPFKNSTELGDIVLIIAQEPKMLLYGLVTSIERDSGKKDEWWNIELTFFTVPLQKAVWTLRTAQMTGQEIFTMGGEERFFQAVDMSPVIPREEAAETKRAAPRKPFIKRIK